MSTSHSLLHLMATRAGARRWQSLLVAAMLGACRHGVVHTDVVAPVEQELATAEVVGLVPLAAVSLADGAAEYRFEAECDLCMPDFLFRITQSAKGKVSGEVFLSWFAIPAATDTSAIARDVRAGPNQCASRLAQAAATASVAFRHDYTWCRVRVARDVSWPRILRTLDSLGVTRIGTATGYAPAPPAAPGDTFTMNGRQVVWTGRGCNDLAGQSFNLETRRGSDYRRARYWCLERPRGDEFGRAAAAESVLFQTIARQ